MTNYLIRRVLLLPFTLFAIILVNFAILNLAPGEPVNLANLSPTGEAMREINDSAMGENQYLLFREHYGLTLPIFFNTWPFLSQIQIKEGLQALTEKETMSAHAYHKLKTLWGDRSRFVMSLLIGEARDKNNSKKTRLLAANLFIRGGLKQGQTGHSLSENARAQNRKVSKQNLHLTELRVIESDAVEVVEEKINKLHAWYLEQGGEEAFSFVGWNKIKTLFFETRFTRYMNRVLHLDFGTLRNDANKTVLSEVAKRMKYSLTLAVIPMLLTFALCQIFGMIMAVKQNRWPDYSLNIFFLILFAIPIFVVAPFLIEKVALHHKIPFTNISIPHAGFHAQQEVYETLSSSQRFADTALHLFLPLIAIMYGSLAIQARLSRTAFLEVLKQDFVRTARAKGLSWPTILIKHVGRAGAITIVTSLAASLGVILGGSLIIETIFEINGFGRFFYEAILNRDYNVVLFSALAGSFLTLVGYLIADIAYTLLDPRVTFS